MLKNCLLAFVLAGLTYMATTSAIAQDNGNSGQQSAAGGAQPEYGRGGRGYHDPAKRARMLTKQLNLSSDQQAKVLDILKLDEMQSKHEQWMGHHPAGQTPGAAPDGSEQK